MYKCLVLDQYGTLRHHTDFIKLKNKLNITLSSKALQEVFEKELFGLPYDLCNDRQVVLKKVNKVLNIDIPFRELEDALLSSLGEVDKYLKKLIQDINIKCSRFKVGILSDCNKVYAISNTNLRHTLGLDFIFNSCELGITKQDPLCYEIVTDLLDCEPDEIVFIDDNATNCKLATEFGWKAFVWGAVDNKFIVNEVKELILT